MNDPQLTPSPAPPTGELPPGDHPLEIAARNGFGPLSPQAQSAWHGNAMPCVTCGQLVHREDLRCEHCEQDLSEEMLAKMRAHAGPWYVLEHVRPFPGVTLDLILRQIQRGLITATSIVRGPATDYQWRFAVETPGLCRYFGRCWKCHAAATPTTIYCEDCLSLLAFEKPSIESKPIRTGPDFSTLVARGASAGPSLRGRGASMPAAPGAPAVHAAQSPDFIEPTRDVAHKAVPRQTLRDSLSELTAALDQTELPPQGDLWDEPPRIGRFRATWIALAILFFTIVALILISSARTPRAATTTGAVMVTETPQSRNA